MRISEHVFYFLLYRRRERAAVSNDGGTSNSNIAISTEAGIVDHIATAYWVSKIYMVLGMTCKRTC